MANQFYEFCPTDTGTNLTDIGDYAVDTDRVSGQKPGAAKSALNNRALRQANFITSQVAQFAANKAAVDLDDDGNTAKLLAILTSLWTPLTPVVTKYTSGSGTHYKTFVFFIASGSATAGATYTNNTFTFTVKETIASGLILYCTGTGAPQASGNLSKSGGTGDTTIAFRAVRAPLSFQVVMAGGGGGGAGSGSADGSAAGDGGDTTFGSALLTASGGVHATRTGSPPAGGAASLGSGPVGLAIPGGSGNGSSSVSVSDNGAGGAGGSNALGGGGAGGTAASAGVAGATNSGGGGGGAGVASNSGSTGCGGGAGGFISATILSPAASYAYAVGAGGTAGGAGTSGNAGAAGAAGVILVTEVFQ